MNGEFYVTTAIPYVNAKPHIGHALELIQADAIARYLRLRGAEVTFQTGTDENAHKNVVAAAKKGIPVGEFVDWNARAFQDLVSTLDLTPDSFIRTTESRHARGVESFWRRLDRDDIDLRSYRGLYCQGCEDFLSPRDLEDGRCPEHLVPPDLVEEANYFFRLSRYQDRLSRLIASEEIAIYPKERKREVLAFIRQGLKDISVSRDARRMSGWGIPVPNDDRQIIYVWIDALMNYLTGVGFQDQGPWREVWNPAVRKIHVIGKNVWKLHAIYWPALLMSASLPVPNHLVVHGFLTAEGRKISKTLGNTVDPVDEVNTWGSDVVRFYLLRLNPFADSDYSRTAVADCYASELAARFGSTVTRVTALCERSGIRHLRLDPNPPAPGEFTRAMEEYRLHAALEELLTVLDRVNGEIARARPWERPEEENTKEEVRHWAAALHAVAYWLQAFIPQAASLVCQILSRDQIRKAPAMFPRREAG